MTTKKGNNNNQQGGCAERTNEENADNIAFGCYRGPRCLEFATGQRAAISFTGGKDCHLALHRALQAGLDVVSLAVFHPPGPPAFRAHRIQLQRAQAQAINLPLVLCPLSELDNNKKSNQPPDYPEAYAGAIRRLQQEFQIQWIVTGDIDYVGTSKTNFMQKVCHDYDCHGVRVLLPLWQQPRMKLLEAMVGTGQNTDNTNLQPLFDIRFSCVKAPYFDGTWLGRRLDSKSIQEMQQISGLDLTGENGEYHTMVVHGPMYAHKLELVDIEPLELSDQPGQNPGERWWVWSDAAKMVSS